MPIAQPLLDHELHLVSKLQPDDWTSIVPAFSFYLASPNCFPLKIMDGGKIAGIGAAIFHQDIAWLAHIIVHPDFRRQGIGLQITRSLLALCEEKEADSVRLIATDMGAPVYEKAGFQTETHYVFYKDLHDNLALGNANLWVIPYQPAFKDRLCELDYLTSGENRIYLYEKHLSGSYLYVNEEVLQGFYVPDLGEGLIVADNADAGVELMKVRFRNKFNAAFPIDNLAATQFLESTGFHPFKTAKRMVWGKLKSFEPGAIYNRIGGNLG